MTVLAARVSRPVLRRPRGGKSFLVAAAILAMAAPAGGRAADGTARDPFTPVGYQPRPREAAGAEEKPTGTLQFSNMSPEQQERLRAKLQVSGIMRAGRDFVALINESLVGAGDVLEISFEGQDLKLLVQAIDRDTIKLEPAPD